MKYKIVSATSFIYFQRDLRDKGSILIRARPFTDSDGVEKYAVMYIEGQ